MAINKNNRLGQFFILLALFGSRDSLLEYCYNVLEYRIQFCLNKDKNQNV